MDAIEFSFGRELTGSLLAQFSAPVENRIDTVRRIKTLSAPLRAALERRVEQVVQEASWATLSGDNREIARALSALDLVNLELCDD